jgi:hypothetical protein
MSSDFSRHSFIYPGLWLRRIGLAFVAWGPTTPRSWCAQSPKEKEGVMRRMLFGLAIASLSLICSLSSAAPPTTPQNVNVVNTPTVNVGNSPSVSIANTPLPVQLDGLVQVGGVVEPVFLAFVENNALGNGPNLETGLPGLPAGTTFHNTSDTTALIYFSVSVNHLSCSRTDVPVTLRIAITDTMGYLPNEGMPDLQALFVKQNDAYFGATESCAWRAQLGPVFVPPDKYIVVQEFWTAALSTNVTQDFFITGYYMK